MKEEVLDILKKESKALTIYDISDALKISDVEKTKELNNVLKELEDEYLIYHTNKDKYMLLEDSPLKKGLMRVNKNGYGFVDVDGMDDDIFVARTNLNGAIHHDTVLVEITSKMNTHRVEGRVLRIINREATNYIGEINFKNDIGYITLDDDKIKLNIEVKKEDSLNAVDGHKVVVSLLDKIDNHGKYYGKVEEIIGHKNDPGIDILSIIYKYDIEVELPKEVVEEVKTMPNEVLEEELKNRKDLRDEVIFTIDGDDTKDIDDAISIKKFQNGNYELGVHIADVSYYVKEGSALDKDAMDRGTSVYLVDRVIPMLPHELSNGICSLNPNVDRLTISCVMEIDPKGKIVKYDIFPSVIKSRKQMTYKNVNKILEEDTIPEGYEEFAEDLKMMKELADILRKEKIERGYIDFDVDETKILVDENCVPTEITLRYRGAGEKLIEDFMIAANETVATHIYNMDLPFIYRVHEYPKEDKIRGFLSFLSSLGYSYNADIKDVKPKTIQKLIESLKDKKEFKILSTLLLRCMQKAVYKPENLGHYALASKSYTHFTSPIRRYPDTTVHRLLRTYLFDHNLDKETIKHWEEKLIFVADHSSAKEMASVNCEREVEDMKHAEYMESHIGEEFEGMISSVLNFGMFVELDNLIEGLVPIKDMDDFYHYDEDNLTLTGEKKHQVFKLGDKVRVKVVRADKAAKQIDFEIIRKL